VDDKAVSTVEAEMEKFGEDADSAGPAAPPGGKLSRGQMVAGQFTDGAWHRVRVEGINNDGTYTVFFLDYGNSDVLDLSSLRALPRDLTAIPPLAHECFLAGLKAPGLKSDYCDDAAMALNELIFDKPLLAKVELKDTANKLHVTLFVSSNPDSINAKLLRDGHVRISSRPNPRLNKVVEALREHELQAKKARRGIWEYGVVSDEEESAAQDQADRSKRAPQNNAKQNAKKDAKSDHKTPAAPATKK